MSSFSRTDKPAEDGRSSFGDVAEPAVAASGEVTALGLAKALGSGVERGLVGLPGLPGDISELVRAAYARVQGLHGPEYRQLAEERMAQAPRSMPTSGEVIEAATPYVPGIDYQPQNFAERAAQTVGEFAPGAVLPGGIVTRGAAVGTKLGRAGADFALQAMAPGVAAEGAQELAGGENAPGWVKPAAAIGTSLATGRVPVPGARSTVPGVQPGAVDRLNRSIADEGGYPVVQQTLADLGPEARLFDVGPNLRNQAEGLVAQPGPSQSTILKEVRERQKGTRDRITALSDRTMGPAEDFDLRTNQIIQDRKLQGDRLYGAARALNPQIDVDPVIANIDSRVPLSVQSGQVKANDIEKALLDVKAQLAGRSTVEELHIAQDAIRGMAETAKRAGAGKLSSDLNQVRDQVLKQLDQGTVDQSGQSLYGKARATYRGDSAIIDAREEGLTVFDRSTRPLTFAREFRQKPQAEQAALKQGGREAVEILLDEARTNATNVLTKLQKPGNEEKLKVLLGPREAGELIRGLEREARFVGSAGKLESASATAAREAAKKEFPSTIPMPEVPIAQRVPTFSQFAMSVPYRGYEHFIAPAQQSMQQAKNLAINRDAGRLLSRPSPADQLLQLQRAYEQGPRRVMPGVRPGFAAFGAELDDDERRRR